MGSSLKSKHVFEETQHYIGVTIPVNATDGERENLLRELELFYVEWYGEEPPVGAFEFTTNLFGGTVARFETMNEQRGTDFHPDYRPDAVDAAEVVTQENTTGNTGYLVDEKENITFTS